MWFCNPSSLPFHIKPVSPSPSVFHSCQLSSAGKADEPVPALQIWPNLLQNRCPGPRSSLLPSHLFCCRNCNVLLASCKGRKNNYFLESRQGIKCFVHSLALKTDIQKPACATMGSEEQLLYPPFHPSCHSAAPTGSSPLSSQFHCCHEVAQRRMLLMVAWPWPCQSDVICGENLEDLIALLAFPDLHS